MRTSNVELVGSTPQKHTLNTSIRQHQARQPYTPWVFAHHRSNGATPFRPSYHVLLRAFWPASLATPLFSLPAEGPGGGERATGNYGELTKNIGGEWGPSQRTWAISSISVPDPSFCARVLLPLCQHRCAHQWGVAIETQFCHFIHPATCSAQSLGRNYYCARGGSLRYSHSMSSMWFG